MKLKTRMKKILAKDKLYYCYKNMREFYMQSSLDFTKLIDNSFFNRKFNNKSTIDYYVVTLWRFP